MVQIKSFLNNSGINSSTQIFALWRTWSDGAWGKKLFDMILGPSQ